MTHAAAASRLTMFAAGIGAFVLIYAAVLVALWQADTLPEMAARGVGLAFFLLIVPLQVLVHEGGHFGMAKLFGWRVPLVSWGPLTLRLAQLKLVFGSPAFGRGTAGAVVAVPPPEDDRNFVWALVSAGGPLADLCLAAASTAAAFAAPSETPRSLLLVAAAVSALSCLINLWPQGGSDGAHLLSILFFKNAPWRGLLARLIEQTVQGVRPRDWPGELVLAVRRQALWSDDSDLMLAMYAWHLDRGETGSAREALEGAAPDARIFAERAFAAAWFDRDAPQARELLQQTRSWRLQGQSCYWRACAALALIEDDQPTAREAIRKGVILTRESPYATALDAEWFEAMAKELT